MKSSMTADTSPAKENAFVPMTESQMDSTKGGLDYADVAGDQEIMDALLDWVEEQCDDPTSAIGQILMNFCIHDLDDAYWDEVSDDLANEGYDWPTLEELEYHTSTGSGI